MSGKKEPKEEVTPPRPQQQEEGASAAEEQEEGRRVPVEPQTARGEKEALEKQLEELTNRLRYLQAEFENYSKRADKERQEIIVNAQEELLMALLPVLDDFDKAVEVLGEDDSGVGLLRTKLLKVLEEHGLKETPASGQRFDPFLHEAVQYAVDEGVEDGVIKEVVRKGYRCNLKVLRPSLVVVTKKEGEKHA